MKTFFGNPPFSNPKTQSLHFAMVYITLLQLFNQYCKLLVANGSMPEPCYSPPWKSLLSENHEFYENYRFIGTTSIFLGVNTSLPITVDTYEALPEDFKIIPFAVKQSLPFEKQLLTIISTVCL